MVFFFFYCTFRVFLWLGIIVALLCGIYAGFMFIVGMYNFLFTENILLPPGWATLTVSITFLGSVQLIGIGCLGNISVVFITKPNCDLILLSRIRRWSEKSKIDFTADDFGLHSSINEAVEQAYEKGVLTSASLVANGIKFDEAIRIAKKKSGLRNRFAYQFDRRKTSNSSHRYPIHCYKRRKTISIPQCFSKENCFETVSNRSSMYRSRKPNSTLYFRWYSINSC